MRRLKFLPISIAVAASLLFAFPSSGALASPLKATSPTWGAAGAYSVLGGTTVTDTVGGTTTMPGNLGVSPGSAVTNILPTQVGPPGVIQAGTAAAGLAQTNNTAVFLALSAAPNVACDTDFGAVTQELSGLALIPGIYCANAFQLSGPLALTLVDGTPTDVWIFRAASTLNSTPGGVASVAFQNGIASPCNVWWRVGSSATIGSLTPFIGNILALTSISLGTNATLAGRALAQNGAVTLDQNTITGAACLTPQVLPTAVPQPPAPTAVPGPTIEKSVSPANARIGDTVTWTITVRNPNPGTGQPVVVTDTLPGVFDVISATSSQGSVTVNGNSITANLGVMSPGQVATITITTVVQPGTSDGPYTNTAFLSIGVNATPSASASATVTIGSLPPELPPTGGGAPDEPAIGWNGVAIVVVSLIMGAGAALWAVTGYQKKRAR